MSEIARPMPGRPAIEKRDVLGGLSLPLTVTWEAGAYAALFVLAFGFRLWDLGARALHHDESLHAYFSYQLLQGHGYGHSPLLHGPFQFFGTAATFFVTGAATDYTARVLPALFGGALVVLPVFFRERLGRIGALLTSTLIAFSPTLLYFSRFAREDIYVALFTLGIVICIWRYIDEQRPHYLYTSAALLALSFATKETTFVFAALMLLFLNLWIAADLAEQSGLERGGTPRAGLRFLVYVPVAWVIVALWPLVGGIRSRLGLGARHPAMDVLLVLGTLAGPQFAAAIELPLEAAGVEIASTADQRLVAVPTVVALLAASAAVGLAWGGRKWLIAAACFYVPYTLLFTAFFTDIEGFGSGIWESLDYWLGQHDVRRADQPEFYYLMFWPAYEYLALVIAGPALLYFSLRGGPRSWLLTAITVVALLFFFGADSFGTSRAVEIAQGAMLPVAAVALFLAVRGTMFERFLVFWAATSLVAFSFVGEKTPWLSVHTTLPLVVLAGYAGGRVFEALIQHRPDTYRLRPGSATARRLAGVAVAVTIIVLAAFSVRTAVLATYGHGDVARELLIFTQTTPDVPDVMKGIQGIAEDSGQGDGLRIQVDEAHRWPWAWYLRDYNVSFHTMDANFVPDPGALLLMDAPNEVNTTAYRDKYHLPRRYTLRWWFPEEYRGIGEKENLGEAIGDFGRDLTEADTWDRWWGFWFHRDVMPRGGTEGRIFVPLEFDALELESTVETDETQSRPSADVEGRYIIGQLGVGPGQMQLPLGVALDGAGNLYVADSGNARVQKLDSRGTPLAGAGGIGGGPGQFQQPSDVAVDGAGNVYVVDTWNHRIQKFAPDLTLAGGWGQPTRDLINPGPMELWGPRGIAVDRNGTLLVADTGTHRIRRYGPDGSYFGHSGRRGKEPGEFEEPTGIAVGPDGAVYVADAGNARIQKFDAGFRFVAAWAVEDWADKNPRNKPQIEALPDGRVIATDPAHGRLLLFSNVGTVSARIDTALDVPLFSPGGVAYDAAGGYVYVTDGLAGHIRRFPLTDFALR
jgi:uncharacterized protein (TIGR03663 family)